MSESAKWYEEIKRDSVLYCRRFLNFFLGLGLLVPVSVGIEAHRLGESDAFVPLAILFIVVLVSFLASIFLSDRRIEYLYTLILVLYPLIYLLMTFFPESHQTYVILLLCMPFVFDVLANNRRISLWKWKSYAFLIVFIAALPAVTGNAASRWKTDFNSGGFYTIHASFLMLCLISGIIQRHTRQNMGKMTSFIMTDGVTGLPSIVAYRESVLPSQPTLVAIVRLDNFSELSALFGYSFAENALKLAANRLSEVRLKLDGSAFRLRNNDFGFLKPLAEGELAEETAKTILQLLAGPYVLQEKTVELNYRIGCTVNLGGDTEKALNEASDALQKAKELGLDIQVHEEDPGHALSAEAAMADLVILSRNVTNKTLCLFYQPVISLATGNIAWNEALLRFRGNENEGEYLEPARLMKLANTTGHWTAIEDFVVESALVHASSPAGSVSINVGLRDFDRSAFLEKIEAGVQKANEHGSQVILEVLEGDFGRANEKRLEAIQALRSAGCLIAIDDFGIGYSNYSRLISFPVDIVKFDRSLVQTASSSDDVAILMEKLTNFCADNGALTVAEGIETEECAEFFSLMGVDFGQGFFWSKPIPEIQALPAGANDLRITKELFLERHSGNPHTLRRYP